MDQINYSELENRTLGKTKTGLDIRIGLSDDLGIISDLNVAMGILPETPLMKIGGSSPVPTVAAQRSWPWMVTEPSDSTRCGR